MNEGERRTAKGAKEKRTRSGLRGEREGLLSAILWYTAPFVPVDRASVVGVASLASPPPSRRRRRRGVVFWFWRGFAFSHSGILLLIEPLPWTAEQIHCTWLISAALQKFVHYVSAMTVQTAAKLNVLPIHGQRPPCIFLKIRM